MSANLTINMFRSDQAQAHNNHTLASSMLSLHHTHDDLSPNQCTSNLVQTIDAPLPLVWSIVRCFNKPQAYKPFVRSCTMLHGDGGIGSVRKITVQSGLPAETSTERLDFLDDEMHVMMFSIIGGDHRLVNFQSTTSMHTEEGGTGKTVVIESYVVDAPAGNTKKETCIFVDTIIGCNHKSLAKVAAQLHGCKLATV